MARLWVFAQAGGVAATVEGLLQPLFGGPSLLGRFPPTSPAVVYGGLQTEDAPLLSLVQATLGAVVGCHLFPGAEHGLETDFDQQVVQEADVSGITVTDPNKRYAWRAGLKITYGRLLLGNPPPNSTAQ